MACFYFSCHQGSCFTIFVDISEPYYQCFLIPKHTQNIQSLRTVSFKEFWITTQKTVVYSGVCGSKQGLDKVYIGHNYVEISSTKRLPLTYIN